jgi:hypothetical protein
MIMAWAVHPSLRAGVAGEAIQQQQRNDWIASPFASLLARNDAGHSEDA